MTWVLLTNDDGVDSPALVPFARALADLWEVRVIVPDGERSWSGKAITRFDPVSVEAVEREGIAITAHTGTPADGVQLGTATLFDEAPSLVVSGINLGFNHGAGYLWSSGTVGAAVEGWVAGIPSIAISTGTMSDWAAWRAEARSEAAAGRWRTLAAVAAGVVDDVVATGLASDVDVVSVNVPWDADRTTPRRVTRVARTGYDRLFAPTGDGTYVHDFGGGISHRGVVPGNDVDAAHDGVISITPLQMPVATEIDETMVARIERKGR